MFVACRKKKGDKALFLEREGKQRMGLSGVGPREKEKGERREREIAKRWRESEILQEKKKVLHVLRRKEKGTTSACGRREKGKEDRIRKNEGAGEGDISPVRRRRIRGEGSRIDAGGYIKNREGERGHDPS